MHDRWTTPRGTEAPLLVVGAMNFGQRTPEDESRRIVARALEAGLVCFDTSNSYQSGESERILGRALKNVPAARIATKVGLFRFKGKAEGLRPERILAAIDESLERLQRDSVDIYYLHAPDHATPIDETLSAIGEVLARGKAKAFAVSNYAAWQILEICLACDARGIARPVQSQVLYNAAIRQIEREYLPFAARYGLHTTVFNPLAGGLFAKPIVRDAPPPAGSRFDGNAIYKRRYWTDRILDFTETLHAIAHDEGVTPAALAYGWLLQRPGVDSILLGPGSVAHLDAALEARPLSEAAMKRIADAQVAFDGTDASYVR